MDRHKKSIHKNVPVF